MSSHLNDFNTIFSQLSAQDVEFKDSVKALFLLITLPESWDIFLHSKQSVTQHQLVVLHPQMWRAVYSQRR